MSAHKIEVNDLFALCEARLDEIQLPKDVHFNEVGKALQATAVADVILGVLHKTRPLRALIVDGFSNHDWAKTTAVIRGLLEKSGRFTVEVTTTPPTADAAGWDAWRPDFPNYDLVVQNTNDIRGGPSWPREVEQALEAYVAGGGGLFVFHSGNNAFPKWDAYNRMIGLGWRKKDFGVALTVSVNEEVVRIPAGEGGDTGHGKRIDALLTRLGDHPIHKDFPKQWLAADLEVYRNARGPAENLTVLSFAKDEKTGLNFPTEWVVHYGEGWVYSSTFGHVWADDANPLGARCVAFQTILVRAAEWLATGKVTSSVPEHFPSESTVSLN